MRNVFWENLLKNIILLILLAPAYPSVQKSLVNLNDKGLAGSLFVAVSILAVTACLYFILPQFHMIFGI